MADDLEFPCFTCPRCHQHTLLTVILGMPSPDVGEASDRGEVLIGGCDITGFEPPTPLRCTECDWEGALLDDDRIVAWPLFAPLEEIARRFENDPSEPAVTFRRLIATLRPDAPYYGAWLVIDEVRPTLLSQRGEACWFADDGEFVIGFPGEHPDFVDVGTYWSSPLDDDDDDAEDEVTDEYDERLLEGSIGCLGSHFFRDHLDEGTHRYMGRCYSEWELERRVSDYDIHWNDGMEATLFGAEPAVHDPETPADHEYLAEFFDRVYAGFEPGPGPDGEFVLELSDRDGVDVAPMCRLADGRFVIRSHDGQRHRFMASLEDAAELIAEQLEAHLGVRRVAPEWDEAWRAVDE